MRNWLRYVDTRTEGCRPSSSSPLLLSLSLLPFSPFLRSPPLSFVSSRSFNNANGVGIVGKDLGEVGCTCGIRLRSALGRSIEYLQSVDLNCLSTSSVASALAIGLIVGLFLVCVGCLSPYPQVLQVYWSNLVVVAVVVVENEFLATGGSSSITAYVSCCCCCC